MKIFIKFPPFMWNTHINCLYTKYSCVILKRYEFNLTLKKTVLKKDIGIKKKVLFILQKKWEKLEQGTKLK